MPTPRVEAAAEGMPATQTDASGTSDDIATSESMAALSFEPWVQDGTVPQPPTNVEWNKLGADYLPTVRLAYLSMFKTKDELVSMCREEPEAFMALVDSETDICKWFECFVAVLQSSSARYLSALSVVAEDDWQVAGREGEETCDDAA